MAYKKLVNKTRLAFKFKLGIDHKGNDIFKNFYIYGISEKAPDNEITKIADFINENFLPYPNNTKIKLKVDYIYIKENEENE